MGNKCLELRMNEGDIPNLIVCEEGNTKTDFYNNFVFPIINYVCEVVKLEILDYKEN